MAHRPWIRRTLGLGFLAGVGYALWRAIEANRTEPRGDWEAQPFPFPPQPRQPRAEAASGPAGVEESGTTPAWIEADDGACPLSHPVKAKRSSGIYHVPGGTSYARTKADRCYPDPAAAEADGLRAAKR